MGRPRWIPPPLDKVEELASRGLTEEQIADALGIARSCYFASKKRYKDFAEAIKRGKSRGIAQVANALFYEATKTTGKAAVSAQIFYLKSRAGWKETDVHEISGKDGEPVVFRYIPAGVPAGGRDDGG